MKDKIIQMVCERAGISPEQANTAVDTVLGYLKDNPDQIRELAGNISPGEAMDAAKKLFGR